MLFALRISILSVIAFWTLELLRPGFVSYYLPLYLFVVPVLVFYVLSLRRSPSWSATMWLDRLFVLFTVLLAIFSQKEALDTFFFPTVFGVLVVWLFLPSWLRSTYSEEYDIS